jgi:hypothetical protein
MIAKHAPIAVANYPKTHPALLILAKLIREGLTGNIWLPDPTPSLAVFSAHVDAYDAAQTKAGSRDPVAVAERDAAALTVAQDIRSIVGYTQRVADAQPSRAEAITVIRSAGLDVKRGTSYRKPELAAKYTGFSGEVLLVARAVRGAGAYYWEYSVNQSDWFAAPETTISRQVITGLTPGQTTYFRFRTLVRGGKTDYSQVVALIVH